MALKLFFCILIVQNTSTGVQAFHKISMTTNVHNHQTDKAQDYPEDNLTTAFDVDNDQINEQINKVNKADEQQNKLFTEQFGDDHTADNIIKRIVQNIQKDESESNYEVTENLIDIPNNKTLLGPVVTNYTIHRPLNLAIIPKNNTINNTEGYNVSENNNANENNNINGEKNPAQNINATIAANASNIKNEGTKGLRKHYISIFHVKAEFDSKPDTHDLVKPFINLNKTVNIHKPYFQPFKDYVHGIKKGLVSGFHNVLNKDKYIELDPGVAGVLINKLRRASAAAAEKVHKAIFGPHFRLEDFDD